MKIDFSSAEKALWTGNSLRNLSLVFSNGKTINNSGICSGSMSFEQSLCEDEQLTFGKVNSSRFSIKLFDTTNSYKGLRVTVKISATDTETNKTYTRNIGVFNVVSDSLTSDKMYRELECYDDLYYILEKDYSEWQNGLTGFPMTIKSYRDKFFNHIGIEQVDISLINDNVQIERGFLAENWSGQNVLESICELNAVFGVINEDGKFQYIKFRTSEDSLLPSDSLHPSTTLYPKDIVAYRVNKDTTNWYHQGTLEYEDYLCKNITQVQIRTDEDDIGCVLGDEGNTYIIQDNPLVYGKGDDALQEIAENFLRHVSFITYRPFSVKMPYCPWIELGDLVGIKTDRADVFGYILHRNIDGISNASMICESKGSEYYSERANGVNRQLAVLKQYTNRKVNTVEQSVSTLQHIVDDIDGVVKTNTSKIEQNAEGIKLSVTQETVIDSINSQMAITGEAIKFKTGTFEIDSNNFSVNSSGDVTIKGKLVASVGSEIDCGTLTGTTITGKELIGGKIVQTVSGSESSSGYYYDADGDEAKIENGIVTCGQVKLTNNVSLVCEGGDDYDGKSGVLVKGHLSTTGAIWSHGRINSNDDIYGHSLYYYDVCKSVSDIKQKKDIHDLQEKDAENFLYALKPKIYRMKYGDGKMKHGFIAQDVREIASFDAVSETDMKNDDGTNVIALDYVGLIADMVSVIQSQNKRITELEKRLNNGE